MKVVIDIPDSDVPTKQDLLNVSLHFIDGTVCEAGGYGFMVLPKEHGDLVDRDVVLDMMNYGILEDNITTISPVIPADKGDNK